MLLLACEGECCSLMFYISPSPHGQWSFGGGEDVPSVLVCCVGADGIELERALSALSLLTGWYCSLAGVAVVLFHCLWFAMRGALLSPFPSSIGVLLEGLRIGCGVIGVSSFLRNLRFRKVILPDPSTLIRYWL